MTDAVDQVVSGVSAGCILCGDAVAKLADLPDGVVDCCVTSPPYWGIRSYHTEGEIGQEWTPADYVARIVAVFEGVRRVLRDDGTAWIVMGDAYYTGNRPGKHVDKGHIGGYANGEVPGGRNTANRRLPPKEAAKIGLKPKDLVGVPWMVAFALRSAGWWLRSEIIWDKPNPMPVTVHDRPVRSHDTIFLLSKSLRYYYDEAAIFEDAVEPCSGKVVGGQKYQAEGSGITHSHRFGWAYTNRGKRRKRSVWHLATQPYRGDHYATFPEKLVEPCVEAGSRVGGIVLDPFVGAGTTLKVAAGLGRRYIGIDINKGYCEQAADRVHGRLFGAVADGGSTEVGT